MTRERAIEVLEYSRNFEGMDYGAPSIALDMAISALREQEECKDLCGLTNAQLGRVIANSYAEGYEDCKAGRAPLARHEGCECCSPVSDADCELMKSFAVMDDYSGKEIANDVDNPTQYIRRYKKKYYLVTEFADDAGTVINCEISNCPMCGRKLEVEG